MRVDNDRLLSAAGEPVSYRQTPNVSAGRVIVPRFLVIHYTAGASAEGAVSWLTTPRSRVSAHLVISRHGAVTQLARFTERTWHAGRSEWGGYSGLNSHAIGLELDNEGPLQGGPGAWRFAGRVVPDEAVLIARHPNGGAERGWRRFPQIQIDAALEVARALVAHYGLKDVVGHDQIAPERKIDPGPAFAMEDFWRAVFAG